MKPKLSHTKRFCSKGLFALFVIFTTTYSYGQINWTVADAGTTKNAGGLTIAYGNGVFVSGWGSGSSIGGTLMTSTDGMNWTTRYNMSGSPTSGVFSMIFAGEKFVVGGNWGKTYTSTDGVSWTQGSYSRYDPINGLAYNGSLYVGVGNLGMIITSTDGLSWASQASGTNNNFGLIGWNGSMFLTSSWGGAIVKSSDGINWTSASQPAGYILHQISVVNGLFAGTDGSGNLFTSSDGSDWTKRALPINSGTTASGPIYWNGTYILGGSDGTIYESNDLDNWITNSSISSQNLYALGSNSEMVLLSGQSGTVVFGVVPEPSMVTLVAAGIALGLVVFRRRIVN